MGLRLSCRTVSDTVGNLADNTNEIAKNCTCRDRITNLLGIETKIKICVMYRDQLYSLTLQK